MAVQTTNYQCPGCTGPLHYAEGSGRLECDFCGSSFSVEEIEALLAPKEQEAAQNFDPSGSEAAAEYSGGKINVDTASPGEEWDASDLNSDWGAETGKLRAYSCPSCGAELICDDTTAATSCPYCGNPTVVPGQFSGALKPNFVIPFQVSKKEAQEKLRKYYSGKFLLPKAFRDENHIQEIKGVYVPFWLFDGTAEGDAAFDASNIRRVYTRGDTEYTEVDHYSVYRRGAMDFEKVPVDASSKMPDEYMDSIEPYDYQTLKPFSTAYLAGYLADKFDRTVEQSRQRADERCETSAETALRDSVSGYSQCSMRTCHVELHRGKVHYALLPVWLLSTRYRGRSFLFAVNGQTGKMVGDLPTSRGRMAALFGAVTGALTAVLGVVMLLVL